MTKPSIALIPSGYKASKLYSVLPNNGDGDFTTTRSTVATRINSNGLVEEVAVNTPRVDYKNSACPSLLLEPSSKNFLVRSQDYSNASWIKRGSPILTTNNLAPDGTSTATKVSIGNSGALDLYQIATGLTASVAFTNSFWLKRITTTGSIKMNNPAAAGSWEIDLSLLSDDWELITKEHSAVTILTSFVASGGGSGGHLYASIDATEREVYIWGSQVEQIGYSTSYIKTTSSTVTRLADVCNNSGTVSDFNSEEGVLYIESQALSDDLTRRKVQISDGTTNNVVTINYETVSNRILCTYKSGGVTQASLSTTAYAITDLLKIAFKWKVNDFALWIGGVEVTFDLAGSVMAASTLDTLDFDGGGFPWYGRCKELRVYKTALTDSELQTLTT